MRKDEFAARLELDGWTLFFACLEQREVDEALVREMRRECVERARQRLQLALLANDPVVAGLRQLFRGTGTDPTRYRPSSEALLRRVLKGNELPAIHPLVDLNNCLSLDLAVPCCVMDAATVEPPYVFRAGQAGESYESLKGPFNLEGKPLLVDRLGPCDAPISGSKRVMIGEDTQKVVLVAYLPGGLVSSAEAHAALERLLTLAPVARVLGSGSSPAEAEEPKQDEDR